MLLFLLCVLSVDEKQRQDFVELSVNEKQRTGMGLPVTTETAESGSVHPDTMDSSQQIDRRDVDIRTPQRETDQSVSSSSVSGGIPISSSLDGDVNYRRPIPAKYETPDALLQHIHEQRRRYEEQRDRMTSQYSLTTNTSSTLANAGVQQAAIHPSLSHQPPSLPSHPQVRVIPAAFPSTLHDDMSMPFSNSGSLPLQQPVSVSPSPHLASSTVPSMGVDSHSLVVPAVQSARVETLSMTEVSAALPTAQSVNSSGRLSTHQSLVDSVTRSHSNDELTDFYHQMVTDKGQWESEAVDVDMADLTSGHDGDIVRERGSDSSVSMSDDVKQAITNSEIVTHCVQIDDSTSLIISPQHLDTPIVSQATECLSDHQHSPLFQQLVTSSSGLTVSPFTSCDVQAHSQRLPHSLMVADGVEEQVDMPPAIVLPSSGSHSPHSSGSGSLIDLSQCVDFSQAFREPGDGCQRLDMEDTDDSRQQSKTALHQHTMSSTLDSASGDSAASQQHPWAFYLTTGVDPPQLTTSSSSHHSFPTLPKRSRDLNSSHHSLPPQHRGSRNKSLSKTCPSSLQIEPDLSCLQTAERLQGSGRVQGYSDSSDSQTIDPETLDGGDVNKDKEISLQEAFLRHKQDFVAASTTRQQQILVKARERERHVPDKRPGKQTSTPLKKNLTLSATERSQQSSRSDLARERPAGFY